MHKTYEVHRLTESMKIDADWDKPQWQKIQPLDIALYMGDKPKFMPKAQAKVLYDDNYLYIIFRVSEKCAKAVEINNNGKVWEDSCVEFFVTPDGDISKGYFNFEINCIGTILNFHQTRLDVNAVQVDQSLITQMNITPSLAKGKPIDPEIPGLTTWTLDIVFPMPYSKNTTLWLNPRPVSNGELISTNVPKPTLTPIGSHGRSSKNPTPQFHLPEYFGTLEFVE